MKYILFMPLVATFAVLASCGRDTAPDGPVVFDVGSTVGMDPFSDIDFNRFFDVVGTVPVQTTDSTLVSYMNIVGDTGEQIIMETGGKIMVINEHDGSVAAIVGRKGNGPGEYNILADAYYDSIDNLIYVYDVARKKMIPYGLSGKFFDSPSMDAGGMVRSLPDGSRFVCVMGTRPSGYKYSIFDRDWNVTRQCDIHVDTAFAMMTFKDCPVISDRGECYLMPFRNDTLYHVTADADIPFAVFYKGNYRIPSDGYTYNALKSNMETKIWDAGGSICMISDYLFYCFSYSGRQYAQVWDAGTGRLVFCDMVSAKDGTPGFTLNICGSDFKLWPHFVSGDDVWCTLGYSDAVKLVPDLQEDDNPVLLHLCHSGRP